MPYYMKQRQKNLIFASNSLEKISARSNSTSLIAYPPGFQPSRAKRQGGNPSHAASTAALTSKYELSRVQVGVDGTGSSKEQPDDSAGEYQDTGYFGPQKSPSPVTSVRKNKPPRGPDDQNPYDITRKIHVPANLPTKKSEQLLPALPSGQVSPNISVD